MTELLKAVQIRHDFVHRNGRTADGTEIILTPDQITRLIKLVQNLIEGIEAQQKKLAEKAKANQKQAANVSVTPPPSTPKPKASPQGKKRP